MSDPRERAEDPITAEEIAEVLRRRRHAQGRTQESVAVANGYRREVLAAMEDGRLLNRVVKFINLLDDLGLDMKIRERAPQT